MIARAGLASLPAVAMASSLAAAAETRPPLSAQQILELARGSHARQDFVLDGGLRQGNHWNYDLAYLYRVLPHGGLGIPALYLVLEMNGQHMRRARLGGAKLPDTGGHLVFLSPGIEFMAFNRVVLEFSSPIPVGRDLNGSQLKPTSSFILGIRWLF